jgi:hypothetical protein
MRDCRGEFAIRVLMNDNGKIVLLVLLGGVAGWLWLSRAGQSFATSAGGKIVDTIERLTRGERNNNPGNIRISGSAWRGKIPVAQNTDGAFEQFTDMLYGVRALGKTLLNYQRVHGLKTVAQIISRWAPGHENPTDSYVTHVANALGVSPSASINLSYPDTLEKLARAIMRFENGRLSTALIPDSVIREGIAKAYT